MTMKPFQRSVVQLDTPPVQQGMTSEHRVRELLKFSDFSKMDPFLVLVEDWFGQDVFDKHPHRGIETVTYQNYTTVTMLDIRLEAGATVSLDLPGTIMLFWYC